MFNDQEVDDMINYCEYLLWLSAHVLCISLDSDEFTNLSKDTNAYNNYVRYINQRNNTK